MFATLGLDCKTDAEYRQDLFSSVAKANQDMEWDCELEKKALKGEKPTGNAFQLNVERYVSRNMNVN
ncbi:hypothetical protein OESDEN_08317 [Oesophagostomum dentatum]|uniref:Uncharacterized protein n=1 Tax=Oesophagostomum dentatum TaxID=61180 RepID=A0A0B1T3J7_OESDE|nr:hypothetical protein OESDEN_08317 [Oesophagostomum dentatum]